MRDSSLKYRAKLDYTLNVVFIDDSTSQDERAH